MNGEPSGPRRPRFSHPHRRRPLRWWLLTLVLIVALMILLPRLLERL